jgi:hypothetical protein
MASREWADVNVHAGGYALCDDDHQKAKKTRLTREQKPDTRGAHEAMH